MFKADETFSDFFGYNFPSDVWRRYQRKYISMPTKMFLDGDEMLISR